MTGSKELTLGLNEEFQEARKANLSLNSKLAPPQYPA